MQAQRLPEWFRNLRSKSGGARKLSSVLEGDVPNSICEEARCPNRGECFTKGVMTFMILGTVCTRACTFCSVATGKPLPPNDGEIDQVLKSIDALDLRFVVLTSPNRDDLPDGGSVFYAKMIRAIKTAYPEIKVEVLIPDFQGNADQLKTVVDAKPDVLNHNLETVPQLYRDVRKGSLYPRSLELLSRVKEMDPTMLTKTGLMVGLGEEADQLRQVFRDVAARGVDVLTLGQYLKPDKKSADVERYYEPREFDILKSWAEQDGIRYVFSGPLVRSSYLADEVFEDLITV